MLTLLQYGKTKATSRWATSTDDSSWVDGFVDNEAIVKQLQALKWKETPQRKEIPSLAEAVYRLFTSKYLTNYAAFATARWIPRQVPTDYISLENVHNSIHTATGGLRNAYGHMQSVPVAAFDPIFWIHHW